MFWHLINSLGHDHRNVGNMRCERCKGVVCYADAQNFSFLKCTPRYNLVTKLCVWCTGEDHFVQCIQSRYWLVSTVPLIVSLNEVKFLRSVECHYRATHCEFQNELDSLLKQS